MWPQTEGVQVRIGALVSDIASDISFSPHTVQGTWTIVLTIIFSVFIALLLVRALVPVKPVPHTEEASLVGFDLASPILSRELESAEA